MMREYVRGQRQKVVHEPAVHDGQKEFKSRHIHILTGCVHVSTLVVIQKEYLGMSARIDRTKTFEFGDDVILHRLLQYAGQLSIHDLSWQRFSSQQMPRGGAVIIFPGQADQLLVNMHKADTDATSISGKNAVNMRGPVWLRPTVS
jgi:hypothetical protein